MYQTVLLLAAAAGTANAHSLEWGSCKRVSPVADFQAEKFEGLWFVNEIFSTSSDCMTMTFNLTGDGSFKVTEAREFHPLEMLGLDHRFSNEGTLDGAGSDPGRFKVTWPGDSDIFGSFGSREAIIMDTDYTTFGLLMECQDFKLFKRISIAILSRKKTLDSSVVARIKTDLEKANYDVEDFDQINHNTCSPAPAFDVGLDEDGTFSMNDAPLNIPDLPDLGELPADVVPDLNDILGARRRR